MAKVPVLPDLDSVDRRTFVPMRIQLGSVPPGTVTAVAEFGYAELGGPGRFQCTTRAEPCVATGTQIEETLPFRFLGEPIPGYRARGGAA